MEKYLYLAINLLTISVPLIRSFEPRINYAKKWKALFPALILTGAVFIIWDHFFTEIGVWGFNSTYLVDLFVFSLPIEEWMFFFTVPFACIFIYEVLNYFVPKDYFKNFSQPLTLVLIAAFLMIGLWNLDKWYTSLNFLFAAMVLGAHLAFFGNKHLGRFYMAYLIHLIPFLIVNSILTGTWIENPIVWYNNAENLSIRLGTIPVEDIVYSMSLLLMNISLYEMFLKKVDHPVITEKLYVKS
ncbi:lycopene cyclase domain-containing protein [Litoribacter ruber]|uniref:lycopene cyclase domain-containing protein n=1 Tax=Litoribacter ruber TaxID=702568 RepID=UPI001BDB27EA|nr:lycopene cyclase domain-containing protein [Litoribacter ruber]MBT0812548.1 lycopene cyclase domain-containing protein [Litoribacter ruber]